MSDLLAKMRKNAGLDKEPDEFEKALAQYAEFVPVVTDGYDSERPGDWFNARHDCEDVLASNGFIKKIDDGRQTRWVHASSKNGDPNVSVFKDNDTCTPFGTRVPMLETGRTYDAFGLFVELEHAGDFSLAAKALRGEMSDGVVIERHDGEAQTPFPVPPTPAVLEPVEAGETVHAGPSDPIAHLAPVLSIVPKRTSPVEEMPSLDWKAIVPRGTFLWRWMDLTEGSELKPEYMFWLGLVALGLAVGDNVLLEDRWPVRSNLFVCLLGSTTVGKSQTTGLLERLMLEAFPYNADDLGSSGVNLISGSGSGEAVVDEFIRSIKNELGEETPIGVKGLIEFNELARFVGIKSRAGSTVETFLMEFYDGYKPVKQTTRTHGRLVARDHFASAITTTQPEAVTSLLTRSDMYSGFLNRWIFGMGPDKPRPALDFTRYDVDSLVEPIREVRNAYYGEETTWLHWSKETAAVWVPFHDSVLEPRRLGKPDFLSGRIDLTLKKIAVLLAVNQHDLVFTADVVERALMTFDYLVQSYELLEGHIGVDDFTTCCRTLEEAIRTYEIETGLPMPKRDVTAHAPQWISRKIVEDAIKNLIYLDTITVMKTPNERGEFYKIA